MRNRVCLEIVDGPLWNSDRVLESKRCNGATLAKVGYYGAGVAVSLCSMRDIYKPRRPRYPLGIQADEVVVQRGLSDARRSLGNSARRLHCPIASSRCDKISRTGPSRVPENTLR
jgi:hypothetical protein